ncbi:MBL fold metallo-hydrolase [Sporocytophaga myxococcoides]|uniref:MBL fold metallo-hydrolase n=1 Tax=Sporocytophaga myxococcoides TaxID=153721 RepID=UPI00055FAD1F|nr:MBL fold metallo-hydrolase [Sporocytophaga myxococcoides]
MNKTIYVNNPSLHTVKVGYPGNLLIDGEFTNSDTKDENSFFKVLKWKLTSNPQREEKKNENYKVDVVKNNNFINSDQDMIVWLGHSTFYIQIDKVKIITDPVFFNLPFIKRKAEFPLAPEDLIDIDYLLLSHGHRDHFDEPSLKILLTNNPSIQILGPLNISTLFKRLDFKGEIQEAGWYQQFKSESIDFVFLPAKHWHRRGFSDFNKVLWGSFYVKGKNKSIYFAGDTAYGSHFNEIRKAVPPIDYCLMPIGAYKPPFLMNLFHVNPEEAFNAYQELHAKYFIPMHYGTFDLSDEPMGEPEREIKRLFREQEGLENLLIEPIGKPIFIS